MVSWAAISQSSSTFLLSTSDLRDHPPDPVRPDPQGRRQGQPFFVKEGHGLPPQAGITDRQVSDGTQHHGRDQSSLGF
jgi:hypothetical protein